MQIVHRLLVNVHAFDRLRAVRTVALVYSSIVWRIVKQSSDASQISTAPSSTLECTVATPNVERVERRTPTLNVLRDLLARIGQAGPAQFHTEQAHIVGKLSGNTGTLDLGHYLANQLGSGEVHSLAHGSQQSVCAVIIVFGRFDLE